MTQNSKNVGVPSYLHGERLNGFLPRGRRHVIHVRFMKGHFRAANLTKWSNIMPENGI